MTVVGRWLLDELSTICVPHTQEPALPRPKAFSIDEALQAAVQTFWARGYTGTSVRQLCAAMGIQSGSFYATFDSKAHLFRLALERYLEGMELGGPGPGALQRYLEHATVDRYPRGCLLVLSALEIEALEPEAAALVAAGLAGLERFFRACLGDRACAAAEAKHLVATATGLMVLHRASVPRDELRNIADRALSILDIGPLPG